MSRAVRFTIVGLGLLLVVPLFFLTQGFRHDTRPWWSEVIAVGTLHRIHIGQERYRARSGRYGHLTDLYQDGAEGVNEELLGGTRFGYSFILDVSADGQRFTARANPRRGKKGPLGRFYYFVDASGVVRFSTHRPASLGDPGGL